MPSQQVVSMSSPASMSRRLLGRVRPLITGAPVGNSERDEHDADGVEHQGHGPEDRHVVEATTTRPYLADTGKPAGGGTSVSS